MFRLTKILSLEAVSAPLFSQVNFRRILFMPAPVDIHKLRGGKQSR
jgi:hypothetical protein